MHTKIKCFTVCSVVSVSTKVEVRGDKEEVKGDKVTLTGNTANNSCMCMRLTMSHIYS